MSVARLASCFAFAAAVALVPLQASAETLYLKNGTQVKGKIVKEDAKSFSVQESGNVRKVPKEDLEVLSTADPVITAVLGLVPGVGHVYVGDYPKAALFMVLGGGAGFGTYKVVEQIRGTASPSTLMASAIAAGAVVALLGDWDAVQQALEQRQRVRYHVDYAE